MFIYTHILTIHTYLNHINIYTYIQIIQESIARIRKSNPHTTTTTSKHNKNTTNTTTNNKITKTNSQTLPKLPPTTTTTNTNNNYNNNTNILSKSKFAFSTYNEDKLMAIKRPNTNLNPLPPTLQPEESHSEKIPLKLPNIYASASTTDQKSDNNNNDNNNNNNNNNNNTNDNSNSIFAATSLPQQPPSVLYERRQTRIEALYTLLTELQTQQQQQYQQQQEQQGQHSSDRGSERDSVGGDVYDKKGDGGVGYDEESVFSHGVTVSNTIYDTTYTTTNTTNTTTESPPPPAETRDTVVDVLTSLLDKMELVHGTV